MGRKEQRQQSKERERVEEIREIENEIKRWRERDIVREGVPKTEGNRKGGREWSRGEHRQRRERERVGERGTHRETEEKEKGTWTEK